MTSVTMVARSRSHMLWAGVLASAAGSAVPVHAQDRNFSVADGQWNVAGNWLENAVPTAANDAYVNGGRIARIGAYAANANYLRLGWEANGWLFQNAGLLTVATTTEVGGIANGGTGYYEISGVGQLITDRLYIARDAANSGMNFSSSMSMRVDRDMFVGGRQFGIFTQNSGIVQIRNDLSLGNFDGGRGEYRLFGGNTSVEGNTYIGWASNSSGRMEIRAAASFGTLGTMHIGRFGATPALHGEVVNSGGRIYAGNNTAKVVVQGSKARLVGTGHYDIIVRYESDQAFGNVNKSVAVQFQRDVLLRASRLNVAPGLTARSGNAASQALITGASIPGTPVGITWGDADFHLGVNHRNVVGTPARHMTIDVPYRAADIPDGPDFSRAVILPRINLMQVGVVRQNADGNPIANTLGQVRNITVKREADVVTGATPDVRGAWDATIVGVAVRPVHQNPNIAALHRSGPAALRLTGAGVLMGQIEGGTPDLDHGAFDNWTVANPAQKLARINGAANPDAHASRVASIMKGYDPLGVQVDGQSRIPAAANQYNNGRGFTGVAPDSYLVSKSMGSTNATFRAAFTDLTNETQDGFGAMKIINMSSRDYYGNTQGPANDNANTRHIDRLIAEKGIIFTKSAGNGGPGAGTITSPGNTYNGIVVGNVVFDAPAPGQLQAYPTNFDVAHASIRSASSIGPTAGGLAKPDLVAQGVGDMATFSMETTDRRGRHIHDPSYQRSGDHGLYSTESRYRDTSSSAASGTSFAAPTVAGVASLLVQDSRRRQAIPTEDPRIRAGQAEDPRVIKSVLQTAADKPAGWARGRVNGADANNTRIPLSHAWGAGLLDPVGTVELVRKGPVPNPAYVLDDSWVRAEIANDSTSNRRGVDVDGVTRILTGDAYYLTGIAPNSPITFTLNWYSHVVDDTREALSSLFLQLYSLDNAGIWQPIAGATSNSVVDNLQHIFVPQYARGGEVLARVFLGANMPAGRATETYALSWDYNAVPAPGTMVVLVAMGIIARRRRREG